MDCGGHKSPSQSRRRREPNLRKLPKASIPTGNHRHTLLHLLAATAGQVDRSIPMSTRGEEVALEKEAGHLLLHLFASPLAATAGRRRRSR
jgi:hypothetical protein